jgi:hypothetical protein
MKNLFKYLKVFLIEFAMAFIFGVITVCLVGYGLDFLEDSMGVPISEITESDKSVFFVAMFVGFPMGTSLGVHITKKFLLKVNEHSILRLMISFIFAFLVGRFLWPTLAAFVNFNKPGTEDALFFPVVAIFSLFGYSLGDIFLKLRKHKIE